MAKRVCHLSTGGQVAPVEQKSDNDPQSSAEDARRKRKRVQNRISQQCLREKRLAQNKQENHLLEVGQHISSGDIRQPDLEASAQLLKENEELREALLRMRKKLLSLSTAGASAADDPIFNRILGRKNGDKRSRERPYSNPPNTEMLERSKAGSPQDEKALILADVNTAIISTNPDHSGTMRPVSNDRTGSLLGLSIENNDNIAIEPMRTSTVPKVLSEQISFVPSRPVGTAGHTPNSSAAASKYGVENKKWCPDQVISPTRVSVPQSGTFLDSAFTSDWLDVSSNYLDHIVHENIGSVGSAVLTSLEEGLVVYIANSFNIQYTRSSALDTNPGIVESIETIKSALAARSAAEMYTRLISDAVRAFVKLSLQYSKLGFLAYGIGMNVHLEKIMKWRMVPTEANRNAVQLPYRPTLMQQRTRGYPLAIDFVTWGPVRDQLILKLGQYNMDEILSDLVRNTVIDIAAFGVAFVVKDLLVNLVQFRNPQLLSQSQPSKAIPKSREEFDLHIKLAMEEFANERLLYETEPTPYTTGYTQETIHNNISTLEKGKVSFSYGLYDLKQMKISKEFAVKYPFMDCSASKMRAFLLD